MGTNAFTNYLENKVLAYVFSGTAYSSPSANLYVALFTSSPGETGGGTELSGNGYVRQLVALTTTNSSSTNASAIEFPVATASWGTITSAAIFDASTGGNMLAYSDLTASKTIASGDVFRIPANNLTVTLE